MTDRTVPDRLATRPSTAGLVAPSRRGPRPERAVVKGWRRGLIVAAALSLIGFGASASPVGPAPMSATAADLGSPPACRYRDVTAARTSKSQFASTLLDTTFRLPSSYHPGDLVGTGLSGGGLIRRVALADLHAMDRAARAAGARFAVQSAFRSYTQQRSTFASWVSVSSYARALRTSARPGHSEHQLGTVLDLRSYGGGAPWRYTNWATTRPGAWLKANAWKFGWVMSYPAGKAAVTCYSYEPWHYRYVGRTEARAIHDSGLTPRQWIWASFGN